MPAADDPSPSASAAADGTPPADPPGLDPADRALAEAVVTPPAGEDGAMTLADLAEHTGTSVALLEAIEREGFLVPSGHGDRRYTAADAEALRSGLALLAAGVPLGELLDLARRYDTAMRGIADHAVELFLRFVRDPIQGSAGSEQEASERLVTAFREMLPATEALVHHHFTRLVLAAARARIEDDGDAAEIAVARREAERHAAGRG